MKYDYYSVLHNPYPANIINSNGEGYVFCKRIVMIRYKRKKKFTYVCVYIEKKWIFQVYLSFEKTLAPASNSNFAIKYSPSEAAIWSGVRWS